MKTVSTLVATLMLCFSSFAMAQGAPLADGGATPQQNLAPQDCTKVPADMKERCEARNKALEACKDKKDDPAAHRQCMAEQRDKPKEDKK
jgi:hypothetical protein